ncbi:hypothetical protein SASPL_111827 [Salvia splendens]|uniref:Uncharacterized protein n=1 Tax=Salvia splendens TaxID=180675 RepID=A0A8X8Y7L1_SALSN|nr:hypothetical protein SASPL_111827 [Salvia splendens]
MDSGGEEILAATLLELVARGWKSDNYFRAGYLTKIEDNIRTEFPDSDLKGTPHITSKISAWKKTYSKEFWEEVVSASIPMANTKLIAMTINGSKLYISHKGKQYCPGTVTMEFLSNLHAETNNRLEMISAHISYEFDLGKAGQKVFDKLGDVEGLTLKQRYKLCNILGDKPQRLEVFIGMPANARLGYLLMLTEDNR